MNRRACAKAQSQDYGIFGYHTLLNTQNHVIALNLQVIYSPKIHLRLTNS